MDFPAAFPRVFLLPSLRRLTLSCTCFLLFTCSERPASDRCCSFATLPAEAKIQSGQGALQVEGSTATSFYVLSGNGERVGYQSMNQLLPLDPGTYDVSINHVVHRAEVREGRLTRCATGTLVVSGNTADYFYVMDSARRELAYDQLGESLSFFPGTYNIRVNNTEIALKVRLKALTQIRTGTLVVHGNTNEYFYVLDDANRQLNYSMLEKPLAFLPGTYPVKVNKTTMKAEILPGKVTELATGSVLVRGLTEEYYYVTDTLGNALNYQALNKALAFFPGAVQVKVNNTLMQGVISAGETAELVTGSLMLTGGGTGYYYVLDDAGNPLNYNSLNKSLSFFPSDYIVKIGGSTRTATVNAGEVTSMDAFD